MATKQGENEAFPGSLCDILNNAVQHNSLFETPESSCQNCNGLVYETGFRIFRRRMAQLAFFGCVGTASMLLCLAACSGPPAPATSSNFPLSAAALVGSTPAVLHAEFGAPTLRRVDGPAQVWLYHSPVCGLNLILYPDNSGVPRVAAAVPDNGDPAGCMASFAHPLVNATLEHPSSS
jgi:hypothetical protein